MHVGLLLTLTACPAAILQPQPQPTAQPQPATEPPATTKPPATQVTTAHLNKLTDSAIQLLGTCSCMQSVTL